MPGNHQYGQGRYPDNRQPDYGRGNVGSDSGAGYAGYGSGDGGYAPGNGGYSPGNGSYAPGNGGYGPGNGGYAPGNGGYGPGNGGYGPGNGGYGPGNGGYGPANGGYGPGNGGYGPGNGGYGPGNGGYGPGNGGYGPGGKPPKKKGNPVAVFFGTLVLIIAVGVFCFAGYKLIGYYLQYKAGSDEYNDLRDDYVSDPDGAQDEGSGADGGADQSSSGQADEGSDEDDGEILKNYKELEDPETVEEKKETAKKKTTTENGREKKLPVLKNPINFDELLEINDEIIGWIRIGAIDREYPVAQAADNDFYLHRTFRKQDNFAGCIFLNCDNSRFFTDQNSIVYGHNMNDGSMFGTLKKFQDQKVYDSNPYFWIFAPDFIYQYRIFSTSTVSAIGDPYRTRFTTADFEEFIQICQSNSYINNHGLKVTTDDRIVTLSTCTGDSSTRFIVQGKLEQIYAAG